MSLSISTSRPVSSFTSLDAASRADSPSWTSPPGAIHQTLWALVDLWPTRSTRSSSTTRVRTASSLPLSPNSILLSSVGTVVFIIPLRPHVSQLEAASSQRLLSDLGSRQGHSSLLLPISLLLRTMVYGWAARPKERSLSDFHYGGPAVTE